MSEIFRVQTRSMRANALFTVCSMGRDIQFIIDDEFGRKVLNLTKEETFRLGSLIKASSELI